MYPKLIKRLDDSDDKLRVAVCSTLKDFFLCAPKSAFSSTTVEYLLEQLFVHLDDPNNEIQLAVFETIISMGKILECRDIVMKRAYQSKSSHRTPVMCEAVISAMSNI